MDFDFPVSIIHYSEGLPAWEVCRCCSMERAVEISRECAYYEPHYRIYDRVDELVVSLKRSKIVLNDAPEV